MASSPPEWFKPGHRALNPDQTDLALKELVHTFPRIVRGMVDEPVPQQGFGIVSMMLLPEPKKTAKGVNVYGFMKLRGNYADDSVCINKAREIVERQDSRNSNKIVAVGAWFPITDAPEIVASTIDVNPDETEEEKIRRETHHDEEVKAKRRLKEVKERAKEFEDHPYEDISSDSLDHYTMRRTAWTRLCEQVDIDRNKLEKLQEKVNMVRKELVDLDARYPHYGSQWVDHYNTERRKLNIPDYNPSEKDIKTYLSNSSSGAPLPSK